MTAVLGLALFGQVLLGQASDLEQAAADAGVDVVDLAGAVNTTGLGAREYLYQVGELARPVAPQSAAIERRLDCISWYESRHTPSATNPRSKAAGQFQFLWSTWASTPQARAGLSPYDPQAAREAARWMIGQGRAREWVPVQLGLC